MLKCGSLRFEKILPIDSGNSPLMRLIALLTVDFADSIGLVIALLILLHAEDAVLLMPLHAEGKNKGRAFVDGVLSGTVEPMWALLTILMAGLIIPAMPYLLSFAAGAMMYVVVEELIPEMSVGEHSDIGVLMFAAGFTLMMAMDVALG